MPNYEDHHIKHLTEVIGFLKVARAATVRGYLQALEELAREGDAKGKDWSEAYEFLKGRALEHAKEPLHETLK